MAAKAGILFLSLAAFCVPALANVPRASSPLNEKPHQGVAGFAVASHRGPAIANALIATGIGRCLCDEGRRSRSTGKERDAETGLDYFLARYYSSAQGRFTSPDEFNGGPVDPVTGGQVEPPGPLPYADIENPQSLNKYAYVLNNPLRYTDPDGHCIPWCTAALGAAGGAVVSIVSQKWSHPDQDINWKSVGIAAVAGGVAGGTMGVLSAPAEIIGLSATTTLATGTAVQASAGAISGVVGGITARGLQTGDANAALGTPGQILKDAAVGAATATVNVTVVKPLVKESTQAGRAVSVGEDKIARGVKASPSLGQRQAQLQTQQRVAGAAASATVKTVIKKKEEEANH